MKKHVSLFLALILVFSAFFALPVEAAKREPNMRDEPYNGGRTEAVCACGDEHRGTELPGAGTMSAAPGASGAETDAVCIHSYQTRPFNASQHKRVCKKCGYSYNVNHSFGYSIQSASSHKKYCSCGYSVSNAHSYGYTNTGNTHTKYCTLCGYSAGSASHSLNSSILSSTTHRIYCSVCGFSTVNAHSYAYTQTGNKHVKYCKLCNYSAGTEDHSYPSKWSCVNSSCHSKRCSLCGFSLTQAHTLEKDAYWDVGLYYEEWCTSSGCGYRYKTALVDVISP